VPAKFCKLSSFPSNASYPADKSEGIFEFKCLAQSHVADGVSRDSLQHTCTKPKKVQKSLQTHAESCPCSWLFVPVLWVRYWVSKCRLYMLELLVCTTYNYILHISQMYYQETFFIDFYLVFICTR
jgi:hypothetical protein